MNEEKRVMCFSTRYACKRSEQVKHADFLLELEL